MRTGRGGFGLPVLLLEDLMTEAEKTRKMSELVLELLDGNRLNQIVLDLWDKSSDEAKKQMSDAIYAKLASTIKDINFKGNEKDRYGNLPGDLHMLQYSVHSIWEKAVREAEPEILKAVREKIAEQKDKIVESIVSSVQAHVSHSVKSAIDKAARGY